MFKLIAGLYTEYINFYKMCQACSVENVVKDFIANVKEKPKAQTS